MDDLIYKSMHQHQKMIEERDQIDVNHPEIGSPLRRPIRSISTAMAAAAVEASVGDRRTVGMRWQRWGVAGGGGIGDPMSGGRGRKKEKRSGQKFQRVNSRMQDIGRPRFGASARWFSVPRAEPNAAHNFVCGFDMFTVTDQHAEP
jgi:hypothetical protein